jgi:hypothetical protein
MYGVGIIAGDAVAARGGVIGGGIGDIGRSIVRSSESIRCRTRPLSDGAGIGRIDAGDGAGGALDGRGGAIVDRIFDGISSVRSSSSEDDL